MVYHITDQDLHCMARRLQWQRIGKTGEAAKCTPCSYCKYTADCFPYRGMKDFGKMAPNNVWVDKKLQVLTGVQLTIRSDTGLEYLLKASALEEYPLECRRLLQSLIEECHDNIELLRKYKLHQEGDGHNGKNAAY